MHPNNKSTNKQINPLYLIAIIPHKELADRVKLFKEEMRDQFGASHALKSPAHITLQMPFRMDPEKEKDIFMCLDRFATKEQCFQIDLEGFDCFSPRVLFIRVLDHKTLKDFHHRFKQNVSQELGLQTKSPFEFHPHMTIATRDLTEEAFNKAWPELEHREFKASFTAKSLFLLKHNGRDWDVYREFLFNG